MSAGEHLPDVTGHISIEARKVRRRGAPPRRGGVGELTRNALKLTEGRIGLVFTVIVLLVAFIGPWVAPNEPAKVVGMPYAQPGGEWLFGLDSIGRDVLSRFLSGGDVLLLMSLACAVVGVGVGTALGLIAGYWRGALGSIIMRTLDIVLSFPALLLALLFLSILGTNPWIILLTVAISHIPYVARVVEASSLAITGRRYVQYAEMIGTPRWRILSREILPGITAPLTVQFGIRFTWSIATIASLAFLGFGRKPPAVDWGVMVQENQIALITSPLTVMLPVLGIVFATIGANLLTDAFGQAAGLEIKRSTRKKRKK
ncbi:MAG: ABC transporter permease [Leucobacter sp.]|nr:ABC transporter permease [Leucobacter sp.]